VANKGKLLWGGLVLLAIAAAAFAVDRGGLLGAGAPKADPVAAKAGGPPVMRRLTQSQYRHVIADIFGPDIKIGGRFDPDMRESGLIEVGAGKVSVPESGLEQYANMARTIAAQLFDKRHRADMIDCRPAAETAPDDSCAARFLSQAGRLLYRRPLTREELAQLVEASGLAAKTVGNFYSGLEITLASMLEAPQFLFDWEVAEADPGHPGQRRLDAWSRASRLSFFLWDTAPDDELLTAAEHGDLDRPEGLARQVDRLLASPRLEAGMRAFFSDMLGFDGFNQLAKDPAIYPKYSFGLAVDAQEQTLRTIVYELLDQKGDYRDLFVTRDTFLSRPLGAVYGIPIAKDAPGATPDGWQFHRFPDGDQHAGILSHISFVALHSHPGRSSSTLRGKAVREIVLCQKVPDPPGNVNFRVVQDTKNPLYKTARERLTAHRTEPTCAGCHKLIDPIGLALENFDSLGTFRAVENDAAIDASGELDGVKFADSAGLGAAVRNHPATPACLVDRIFSYAVGRTPTKSEIEWLRSDLAKSFAEDGYRVAPLMRRIATSEVFFRIIGAEDAPVRSASAEGGRE
jgi:hypothetical protein